MSISRALDALQPLLGDRLSTSKGEREAHGRSETHFPLMPPDAVAWPESTEEVAEIVTICAAEGYPVIGWGAGTSLEGHALAPRGGLTLDFSRMDRVLEVRPEDMVARVQPGLTRMRLNEELRATGLFFPVDPGADASIGGMAMTRASGTTAVRYGTMRDNVMGLTAVLADGRVIRTGGMARKSSSGYDLTGLLVGSEGTLALVTELTLRLHGQPEAVSAAICAFPSLDEAVAAVTETVQSGIPMARIEFVDAATVACFNTQSGARMPEAPHLMLEFHGSPSAVEEQAAAFGEIAADHGAKGLEWASQGEDRARLWDMRHRAYWSILASRPGATAVVTDVCVPVSNLAQAVRETQEDIAASGLSGPILGHVGDGNFHAILMVDRDSAEERETALALSSRMAERALHLKGTITGEHGIGMGKLDYMAAEHGPAWDVMAEIKRALDPGNILNPGKVVFRN